MTSNIWRGRFHRQAALALCLSSRLLIGAEDELTDPPRGSDSTDGEATLSPVVITATRTETPASKTAASVTVIDQNDIETRQYGLLADALRLVPGLAIVNNGSPGTVAGVFLRGTKTANTMVLIDGRPVPFNLAGSFNVETTPLDNVERIEVLRGPASSLYGGRTIGGVINVLTRDGRDLEKPETTAFFEAGSYGSIREGISHLGSADRLDWGLEFTRTDFEGQRLNSRFENTSAAGKVGWQATDTIRLDLDLRYYNADVGVPGPIAGLGANDPDNHLLTEFWSLSPRLIWDTTENWRQTLTFSTSNFRQVATNFAPGFGLNNRITVRTQFLEYLSVVDITERWSVTAGTSLWDVVYSRYNDDAPGLFNPGGLSYDVDQSETNWAIFAQSQVKITDRLQWLAGVRRDEYSDFGSDITWRTGASWRIPVTETLLHANYGTAFAPPTPQDREPALFGLPTLLKPERSRGVEVGLTQPLFEERVSASITWFRNDIRNYIEFDPVLFAMQQIDRARTQGLECQLDFRSCDRVEFGLGYTYLDADNRSDNRRLVRRPRHTVTAQASVRPVDALTLGFTANWVIDREDGFGVGQSDQEDFFNVRLFGSWQLTENISLFGRVENLLGDDYQEARGFPALDTGAYAGVKVKF